jgi:hypothetical protein
LLHGTAPALHLSQVASMAGSECTYHLTKPAVLHRSLTTRKA